MYNFSIQFSYPWLLLLLIPAIALTLLPYFRLSKRYRKTRNRIMSIVLHLVIMVLAITTLAGIEFHYQIPNQENEIILLVDVSDTEEQSAEQRDDFVYTVLQDSQFDNYKVGVVTFGFDQEYAVPLTRDVKNIYNRYLEAKRPDTSATNIASALTYAKDLFEYPETAKIVLITDGKETDEKAIDVIRSVTAQGTRVDTAYIPSNYEGSDVQLIGVELPDYHVNVNEACPLSLTVHSNAATTVTVSLYDNGEENAEAVWSGELQEGSQTLAFEHSFVTAGLHELQFKATVNGDALEENNAYTTYLNLEVFNKILILESAEGESEALAEMLNADNAYEIDIMTTDSTTVPTTVDGLRAYDQVILNNVANFNLPEGFDAIMEEYVSVYGGGLFTVGGNDSSGNANAYNRADMYGTLYQQMLPVEAINYTPPVGVVLIIDRSGSMSAESSGSTLLEWAKAGASSCLDALTDRDYMGIMTLDSEQSTIVGLTSCTQKSKILAGINTIEEAEGGTLFAPAIERAGIALSNPSLPIAKRHIIIVTDGEPNDPAEEYEPFIETNFGKGITLSVVGINMQKGSSAYKKMQSAVELGHGRLITGNTEELIRLMREELNVPEIQEMNYETFNPIVFNNTSPLVQGLDRGTGDDSDKLTVTLDGFYGGKVRDAADLILMGDFNVPIYAQWKYGKGMVGSFMCDLKGVGDSWASAFMSDSNGQRFIFNVVNNLMPVENIRPNDIKINLKEDNYTNKLSIYTDLKDGEYIKGQVIQIKDDGEVVTDMGAVCDKKAEERRELACYVSLALTASNNYSRCDFVVRESGVYKIVLTKYDAEGKELDLPLVVYKAFAYSEEYLTFTEEVEITPEENLQMLAERGNGALVEDLENPVEIFGDFITALERSFDPRFVFMIMALCLFLLDIAVRKFKFKWPHELIRAWKEKRSSKK